MTKRLGQKGATFRDVLNAFHAMPNRPCTNSSFSNQCAIRVSHALMDCDVDLSGLNATRCWNDTSKYIGKHIIRAEEFGNALKRKSLPGLGKLQTVEAGEYQTELNGKRGIVFFKDYWQRSGETIANRSGDHIDLWNQNRTTGYWFSWSRNFWESLSSDVSDRNKSREIWFWPFP
ncbi:type VI secretion system amidase effector protein Tae4 [Roseiconus lacunae]|uniref:Type VI secretion system amidase effector protein Tae4 n=1 Tax=Roseiconus lacunae TaxID=2605694 RepID=A0ABT7PP07_9BACT|nr:type VI secretion system amidase effector protein Tae4 [Roseiconus lacunae]MDM4018234.1 type VI secretion system amidase effector protein Tae4 [Roseiconus lacunae]